MKFRRQKKTDSGVNLTPLIDVVFLLLIFFMVSTTFTEETHLVVELPEAEGAQATESPQIIDIVITRDGSFSINGMVLINNKAETIIKGLKEVSAGNTDLPVIITADASTTHQSVVTAMDAAGRLGFVKLRITTMFPDES